MLAEIQRKEEEFGKSFNLDALRVTPTELYYDHSPPNVLRGRGRTKKKKIDIDKDYGGGDKAEDTIPPNVLKGRGKSKKKKIDRDYGGGEKADNSKPSDELPEASLKMHKIMQAEVDVDTFDSDEDSYDEQVIDDVMEAAIEYGFDP